MYLEYIKIKFIMIGFNWFDLIAYIVKLNEINNKKYKVMEE